MFDILILLFVLFIDFSYECLPGIYCKNILGEYRMKKNSCNTNGILIDSTFTLGDLVNYDKNKKCINDEDIGVKTNHDAKFSQSLSNLNFPLHSISFSLWFKGVDTSSSVIQISNSETNIPLLSLRLKKILYYNNNSNNYDSVVFKNITYFQYNNEVIIISNNTLKVYVNSEFVFKSNINFSFQLLNSKSIIDFFTTNSMMFYYFSIYNEDLSAENIKRNYEIGFQPSFPNFYTQTPIATLENNEININLYYIWSDEYYMKPMIDNVTKYIKIEIVPPNMGFLKINQTNIISPLNISIENLVLSYVPPQNTFNEIEYIYIIISNSPFTDFTINMEYDGNYQSQKFNITVLPHIYPPISINSTQTLEYLKNQNIHFPTPIFHPLSKNIKIVIKELPIYGNISLDDIDNLEYFNFTNINNIIYKGIENQKLCQTNELYFEDKISYYIEDVINNVVSSFYTITFLV